MAGAPLESGWKKEVGFSFCWSGIVDAIVVVFVVMVGTKEMGVVVLQRKLCLVVAWLRKMILVGCGLRHQKLGIFLLFNGYVIYFSS